MNYTNRRRGGSKFKKTIRDYIVPIIGGVLVLVLLIFLFKGGDGEEKRNPENQVGIEVSFDSEWSEATLVYPWDRKKDMEADTFLYKWEKVIVKQWSVTIRDGTSLDFRVNKLWELKFLENWDYEVSSWEVWLNTEIPVNVNMNFVSLKVDPKSHLSMSQNEMWSTVYLISWYVEVSNLSGKTTVLAPWEKITVTRTDASKKDLDMALLKENIDQFFLKWEWYIMNKGSSFENLDWEEWWIEDITWTWSTNKPNSSWTTSWSKNEYLSFNNLIDASNVSSSSINITWTYSNDEIYKITVNWKEAVLNKEEKTFKIENVNTSKYENDLVFKVMDDANDVLSKFVYTVYYNSWTNPSSSSSSSSSWGYNTQIYDVDGSKFVFTSPTSANTYTSDETFITIRWKVDQSWITSVTVNDYKLSSFNWSTWRYHASTDNNNLAIWTNVYEIKYYSWDTLVYTNYYTIIRKESLPKQEESSETWTIASWDEETTE